MSKLILIPTSLERQTLEPLIAGSLDPEDDAIELCGFGIVAAAARTAQLIATRRPDKVFLMGIAGAIGSTLDVGDAAAFSEVACYGVGAGTGVMHQTANDMGWNQWPGIHDVIALGTARRHRLLTVGAASGSIADVQLRVDRFPGIVAEDMEGYAVAMACRIADVPLTIIRGISNVAGDRDVNGWKIAEALEAAAKLLRTA